jgi:hypothetical protein
MDMMWYVLLGLLAAFGLLCILWALFGFLLPGCSRCTIVLLCKPEREAPLLRRLLWLRELGVLRCGILLSGRGLTVQQRRHIQHKYHCVEFYDPDLPGE